MSKLSGKRFIFFVEEDYEDLSYGTKDKIDRGRSRDRSGKSRRAIYRGKHGYPCKSEISFDEVNPMITTY